MYEQWRPHRIGWNTSTGLVKIRRSWIWATYLDEMASYIDIFEFGMGEITSSHCGTSLIFRVDPDPESVARHKRFYHQEHFQPDRARSRWLRNAHAARATRALRASGTPGHNLGSGHALERQITM